MPWHTERLQELQRKHKVHGALVLRKGKPGASADTIRPQRQGWETNEDHNPCWREEPAHKGRCKSCVSLSTASTTAFQRAGNLLRAPGWKYTGFWLPEEKGLNPPLSQQQHTWILSQMEFCSHHSSPSRWPSGDIPAVNVPLPWQGEQCQSHALEKFPKAGTTLDSTHTSLPGVAASAPPVSKLSSSRQIA